MNSLARLALLAIAVFFSGHAIANDLTVLFEAMGRKNHPKIEEILSTKKVHPNDYDSSGNAPIHWAAGQGDVRILSTLLAHGADPNLPTLRVPKQKPLYIAASHANLEAAKILFEKGAKVAAERDDGYTALHAAAGNYQRDTRPVAQWLLSKGADPNAKAANGSTVLESALGVENLPIFELLLNSGASVETIGSLGQTIVFDAAISDNPKFLEAVLAKRASLTVIDTFYGYSPLHHAAQFGTETTVRLLLQAGADPSARSVGGESSQSQQRKGLLPEDIAVLELAIRPGNKEYEKIIKILRQARSPHR